MREKWFIRHKAAYLSELLTVGSKRPLPFCRRCDGILLQKDLFQAFNKEPYLTISNIQGW
jgi:hypothetical protein